MKICYGHYMHDDLCRQPLVRLLDNGKTQDFSKERSQFYTDLWFLSVSTFSSLEHALIQKESKKNLEQYQSDCKNRESFSVFYHTYHDSI